jgi:hypothetical protein
MNIENSSPKNTKIKEIIIAVGRVGSSTLFWLNIIIKIV